MGERIRMLRLARGLSQDQLSKKLGVTVGAVSQWESGATENIRLRTFLELCEVLVVTPHYLVLGPSATGPQSLPSQLRPARR